MEYTSLVAIILIIVIMIYLLYEAYTRRPRRTLYIVRELLVCSRCGYKVERDFEPGDFIGLVKGRCPKCDGDLKLRGIYAIERGKT